MRESSLHRTLICNSYTTETKQLVWRLPQSESESPRNMLRWRIRNRRSARPFKLNLNINFFTLLFSFAFFSLLKCQQFHESHTQNVEWKIYFSSQLLLFVLDEIPRLCCKNNPILIFNNNLWFVFASHV